MYYDNVIEALNKNKVKYAVAGGVAVVLYGCTRLTLDLDLIVDFDEKNLEKFFDTLYNLGYRPKIPVTKEQFKKRSNHLEWIKKKNMIVFSFFHLEDHLKVIDVFVKEPIRLSEVFRKIKKIKIGKTIFPAVSPEHLKRLKEIAARPKDLFDLRNLEEIQRLSNGKSKNKQL